MERRAHRIVGACCIVGKGDVLKGDGAALDFERRGLRRVADLRLAVEQREDADRRGQALLQVGVQPGQALDRLVGEQEGGNEGEEGARRLGAGDHLAPAIEDDRDDGQATEDLHDRVQRATRARALVVEPEDRLDRPCRADVLVGLHGIGLDVAHALEGLVEQRRQLPDLGLGAVGDLAHAPADAHDREDRGREHRDGDQREAPILVE